MPSISAKWSGPGWLKKTIEAAWAADTIRLTLHSSSLSFDQDTTTWWSDVSASELSTAAGYTAGGITLGTKSTTYTAASNNIWVTAAAVSWTASGAGFAFRYVVATKWTGTAGTSPIVGVGDTGSTQTIASGDVVTVNFSTSTGLAYVTIAA